MVGFLFSPETRRNPYPWYEQMRAASPVFCDPNTGSWMLFDYASVRTAMSDPETFSSRVVPPGGRAPDWLVFNDPPRHSVLRAVVMRAFTPRAPGHRPALHDRAWQRRRRTSQRGRRLRFLPAIPFGRDGNDDEPHRQFGGDAAGASRSAADASRTASAPARCHRGDRPIQVAGAGDVPPDHA